MSAAAPCGAIPPNVGGPVPCHLEAGHDGEHFSTSGCAGSEVRWLDADDDGYEWDERYDPKEDPYRTTPLTPAARAEGATE